jgi:peroxiredoxin
MVEDMEIAMADQGTPGVGARAPEFVLRRTFEEKIGLSDLLADGPLLLAFYVFDFGPV